MLDKLPYIFKGWHLKRRHVHKTIKMLQMEYRMKAPDTLRYHKHARIETNTTGGGFYCPLSKKLINLLLNKRMMSCSHLDIKVPEVMEQGRIGSKLKMVAPNHIKHKPVGCNASPLIKKFEKHTKEPNLWSGFATPLRRKGLRQTHRMSLYQRPINMAIQASLTRRNHLLKTVKGTVKPKPQDTTWKQN